MDTCLSKDYNYKVVGDQINHSDDILTPEALNFIMSLQQKFGDTRESLLSERNIMQANIDNGIFPNFLDETVNVRNSDWKVNPIPS